MIDFRERQKEREREGERDTDLLVHWLILMCVLTKDGTGNFGVPGQCSNQLSYLARDSVVCLKQNVTGSGLHSNIYSGKKKMRKRPHWKWKVILKPLCTNVSKER